MEDKDLKTSMKAHNHIKPPESEVTFTVTGNELLVILDCLLNVHSALIKKLTSSRDSETEKKKTYDFAYDTELVYELLMSQLKLIRNKREDLN